nr:MAG TPA: hypothetical protein [Caudoviricetes sp.]
MGKINKSVSFLRFFVYLENITSVNIKFDYTFHQSNIRKGCCFFVYNIPL